MEPKKISISKIPGWLIVLVIFGTLYFTGLHTEVLGKIQSAFLATGLIKPDLSETEITDDNANSAPANHKMAGSGFQLKTLTGESVSLESLYGKTIFLNIWATWCPPCIAEMPNIQKLYDKLNHEDVAFVMLSVDKNKDKAEDFIKRKGYTFPVYIANGSIHNDFNVSAIPTTFVISPEGKIVLEKQGMADYNTDEFIEFLGKLKGNQ